MIFQVKYFKGIDKIIRLGKTKSKVYQNPIHKTASKSWQVVQLDQESAISERVCLLTC